MKADILKGWINYLSKNVYVFNVDEEKGNISFQENYGCVDGICSFELKIEDNNYRAYVKLPVMVEEDNRDQVLDYIFLANGNPMFAHFTYDCEENNVFCVHGTFCDGILTDEIIEVTLNSIRSFLYSFYDGLKLVAEESMSAEETYEKRFK